MRVLNTFELTNVAGGEPGPHDDYSYTGEESFLEVIQAQARAASVCYTVTIGPISQQTCVPLSGQGPKTVQTCLQLGVSGTVGPIGAGASGQICDQPQPVK